MSEVVPNSVKNNVGSGMNIGLIVSVKRVETDQADIPDVKQ